MVLNIKLLDIPYESVYTDGRGNHDMSRELVAGTSKFVNVLGRIIIVADIDGYAMPFYLSTGRGGKSLVPAGRWYPFFGLCADDFWLNKMDSATIAEYYHSPALKHICGELDKTLGDMRNVADKYPAPSVKSRRAIDFINQSFARVTANGTRDTIRIVTENVANATNTINNIYKRAAMHDASNKMSHRMTNVTPIIQNDRNI